ncbi:MAG: hypothetical protein RR547_04870 [Raoultibacter sp.]
MKKNIRSLLAFVLTLCMCVSITGAIADTVTIASGSTSKGGASYSKGSATAEPYIDYEGVTAGSKITFWVWKNGLKQVTPTYDFLSTGEKKVYYTSSSYKVEGDMYHSVWKKNGQASTTKVTVTFTFKP